MTTTLRNRERARIASQRTVLCLLAAPLLMAACGGSRSEPVTLEFPGLTLSAALAPRMARAGENSIWLELRDPAGAPVDGADLSVKVHMHAMGTMPPMGGATTVTPEGGGRYRADFELDMGGNWIVEILGKTPAGGSLAANGSLTVGTPGLRLEAPGAAARAPHGNPAELPRGSSEETHPTEVSLDPGRLQKIGVRTGSVEEKPLDVRIRSVARISYDETALRDVSLKFRGWIGNLEADAVGNRVERGATLFTIYSPELFSAQQEYLQALASQRAAQQTQTPDRADYLVRAARKRLQLWDISDSDIDRVAREGAALEYLPVRSPASGYLIEKNVVEGGAVLPGERLFRIAPLDRVWLEAEIYESDLSLVEAGQQALITLPYLPGKRFEGRVAYVYPYLADGTRTGRVRIELPNPELALRPDMYANVELVVPLGNRLVVPVSAVLFAGERSFVFRDLGGGRFQAQPVRLGERSGEEIEVLEGLGAGERIVTSGTFLIASESRLQSAIESW